MHRVWALVWCPRKRKLGAQTVCIALLLLAWTTSPARADCPAAPIADPDDMAISFLAVNGVQAASASLLASSSKEGTLVYDDTANALKICDGTNWVGVGSGADTLAGLSCSAGEIPKYDGAAWACAADSGASGINVNFAVSGGSNSTTGTTKYNFTTESWDNGGYFDLSNDRFTPLVAGKYLFIAKVANASATDGYASSLTILKNGSVEVGGGLDRVSVYSSTTATAVGIAYMNGTTDYIEFMNYLDGGTNTLYAYGYLLSSAAGGSSQWSDVTGGITYAGGKVGIGTTTPQSSLHVQGGIQLADDSASCPGPSNAKLGTLRVNSGMLQLCGATGWTTVGGGVPAGTIAAFAATACPTGWTEYPSTRARTGAWSCASRAWVRPLRPSMRG